MKRIIDLHHHLDTLQDYSQIRSRIQKHRINLSDHIVSETQTIISVPLYATPLQSYETIKNMAKETIQRVREMGQEVRIIKTKNDLEGDYKLGIILHVESARLIRKPESQIEELFDLGVRGIIPIHFIDNHLGQSCDDPMRRIKIKQNDSGLTDEGRSFVEILNKFNMWVDVSHTSDRTGYDILEVGDNIMASHIGIRDLCPRARNKPLSFFKKLNEKKGIFGLIPWQHLVGNKADGYYSQMKFAIDQGIGEMVCLGSDFGAPIKTHENIKSLYDCASVADSFGEIGLKIQSQNAFDFFQRSLPS